MATKTPKLVTRESLQKLLDNPDPKFVERVVGRALWGIFLGQTESEKNANATKDHNNIGFASCDAKSGSLTAKAWKRNGYLSAWQLDKWLKKGDNGFSRLTKYHRQLNDIAIKRQK